MNHAISGKPGDGKGLFSMRLINNDVRRTFRPILTDLAIEKLPWVTADYRPRIGYQAYLRREYKTDYNVCERVFRLKPPAMANFFLYRSLNRRQVEELGAAHLVGYREVTPLDDVLEDSEWLHHKDFKLYVADHEIRELKNGKSVVEKYDTRLSLISGGHLCLKDEAWHAYPARGWSSTSEGILYYMSMVRRFGDDFYIVSQRFNDVDSILMDRCQNYYGCKNHGRLRFGRFKQPPIYSVSIFQHRPTPSSEPDHKVRFTLDKHGLAECYDTSGGIGVAGRVVADVDRKQTGLPIWTIPVGGLVAIWLLIQGVHYGTRWIHDKLVPAKKPVAVAAKPAPSDAPKKSSHGITSDADSPVQDSGSQTNQPDLYCTGYMFLNGRPLAFLSDGTTWQFPSVQMIKEHSLVINGKEYPLRPGRAQTDYQPEPPPFSGGVIIPRRPINDAQVTVIGEPKDRSPARLNGFQARPGLNPLQRPSGL